MNKVKKIASVLIIIILSLFLCLSIFNLNVVFAYEDSSNFIGYSSSLTYYELKEQTTTTNFTTIDYENSNFEFSETSQEVDDPTLPLNR